MTKMLVEGIRRRSWPKPLGSRGRGMMRMMEREDRPTPAARKISLEDLVTRGMSPTPIQNLSQYQKDGGEMSQRR